MADAHHPTALLLLSIRPTELLLLLLALQLLVLTPMKTGATCCCATATAAAAPTHTTSPARPMSWHSTVRVGVLVLQQARPQLIPQRLTSTVTAAAETEAEEQGEGTQVAIPLTAAAAATMAVQVQQAGGSMTGSCRRESGSAPSASLAGGRTARTRPSLRARLPCPPPGLPCHGQ